MRRRNSPLCRTLLPRSFPLPSRLCYSWTTDTPEFIDLRGLQGTKSIMDCYAVKTGMFIRLFSYMNTVWHRLTKESSNYMPKSAKHYQTQFAWRSSTCFATEKNQ